MYKMTMTEKVSRIGADILGGCLALIVTLLCVCCSREDTTINGGFLEGKDLPILFQAAGLTGSEVSGKGVMIMHDTTLNEMGVFGGFLLSKDVPAEQMALNYLPNIRYSLTPEGYYDTNPVRYWPLDGYLTFFAYTPFFPNFTDYLAPGTSITSRGYPKLIWTPKANPSEQIDVCLAVAKQQPRELYVPLEFHHATAQLYFAANYVELADYEYIIIDSLRIGGLIGSKTMTVTENPPYAQWESDGMLPRDTEYLLYYEKGDPNSSLDSIPLPIISDNVDGGVISNSPKGSLFVVPQEFDGVRNVVSLQVYYTLWYYDEVRAIGPRIERQMCLDTKLPACKWESDNRYRYVLSIYDKTRKVHGNVINDYMVKQADFYPMTCDFTELSVSNAKGFIDTLQVIVGPKAVAGPNKILQYYTSRTDSAYVKITSFTPATGEYADYNSMLRVECIEVTPPNYSVKIYAKTTIAASEDEKLTSICEYKVTPSGLSFSDVPVDNHTW